MKLKIATILFILIWSIPAYAQKEYNDLINLQKNKTLKEKMKRFEKVGMGRPLNVGNLTPEDLIDQAKKYMGTPYCMGGTSKKCMDCSGLFYTSFKQLGINPPRTAEAFARFGKLVTDKSQLQKGDMLFFVNTYNTSKLITHTGLVINDKQFLHAASKGVVIVNIDNPSYWNKYYIFSTRIWDMPEPTKHSQRNKKKHEKIPQQTVADNQPKLDPTPAKTRQERPTPENPTIDQNPTPKKKPLIDFDLSGLEMLPPPSQDTSQPPIYVPLVPDEETEESYVQFTPSYALEIGLKEKGMAYYFPESHQGTTTGSGEKYDNSEFSAAHKTLPFGSIVRITNLSNKKWVHVRINDRGPFSETRLIDISKAAAQEIDMLNKGLVEVEVEIVSVEQY